MPMSRAIGWSVGYLISFGLLFLVAVMTPTGQAIDIRSFGSFDWMGPPALDILGGARSASLVTLAVLSVSVVAIALRRGQLMDAATASAGVGVVLVVTTYTRDDLFARPFFGDFGYLQNSFPSRHVAVSMSLCILVVALFPRRARCNRIIVSGLVAVAVVASIASVSTMAHRGSDVVGGLLLAGAMVPWMTRGRSPVVIAVRPEISYGTLVVLSLALIGATWGDDQLSRASVGVVLVIVTTAIAVLTLAGGHLESSRDRGSFSHVSFDSVAKSRSEERRRGDHISGS